MPSKLKNHRGQPPACKNSLASVPNRVKELLCGMALEEKVARTIAVWQEKTQKLVDTQANFEQSKL